MTTTTPNLFVVGAMRAGTTSIFSWLSQHPSVHTAAVKEPHWFAFPDVPPAYSGPGDVQLNERIVWRGSEYRALFAGGTEQTYRAEASAMYLHLPAAVERLLEASDEECDPRSRFVVSLREPVERTMSAFSYNRMRGREPLSSLRDALDAEDGRRAAGWSPMFWYEGASQISSQLERLLEVAPDRTHIVLHSDLSRAPDVAATDLFRWLDLPPVPDLDTSPRNRSGEARSAALARVLRHSSTKRRLKPFVPPPLRRSLERLRERNRSQPDLLDPETRALLEGRLDEEVRRLSSLVGRSITG